VRTRELKELASESLGMHRLAELRQALLPLSNGLDERVDDRLRSDGEAKHPLSGLRVY